MSGANREYKDSVFRDMLRDKKRIGDVHFALRGVRLSEEEIKINTLEGIIAGKLRNDVSYMARDLHMMLMEHQSTMNPNMPIRMLMYAVDLYKPLVLRNAIYKNRLIIIPACGLYMFYNGKEKMPERWTIKLSDSFKAKPSAIEATVTVININYSPNSEILVRSPTLMAYSVFVDRARQGKARGMDDEYALSDAVEYCINNDYMSDYFDAKKEEVVRVMKMQWNMDRAIKVGREESFEDGREMGRSEGRKEGHKEGRIEERIEMIINMILEKAPLSFISKVSGWSEEKILALGIV